MPTFTGPDGATYEYADPAAAPAMDLVDSTEVPDVPDAPTRDEQVGTGESTAAVPS